MKLPNGYGSVTKLSGKRRKPYVVRVTTGKEYDEGKEDYRQIRTVLGCYKTRVEAINSLCEYNKNPYDLTNNNITFGEVYEVWKKEKFIKLSNSSISSYNAAYNYCEPIINERLRDIRTSLLQNAIDLCPHGSSTKKNILGIMHQVMAYGMQNNLINKDYSDYIQIEASDPTIERSLFTSDEINLLWGASAGRYDVQIILILIYSGMRVNELLKLPREHCNLEERYLSVPKELAKNKSSIRKIPIHSRILQFITDFYNQNGNNLILNNSGSIVRYNNFVNRELKKINEEFHINHKFHDTRHTFVTRAHKNKMDELCLKLIVGHEIKGITQKVYTHVEIPELLKEINKISY